MLIILSIFYLYRVFTFALLNFTVIQKQQQQQCLLILLLLLLVLFAVAFVVAAASSSSRNSFYITFKSGKVQRMMRTLN